MVNYYDKNKTKNKVYIVIVFSRYKKKLIIVEISLLPKLFKTKLSLLTLNDRISRRVGNFHS